MGEEREAPDCQSREKEIQVTFTISQLKTVTSALRDYCRNPRDDDMREERAQVIAAMKSIVKATL